MQTSFAGSRYCNPAGVIPLFKLTVASAELRYRPTNAEGWHSADVRDQLSQYSFRLPAITLSLESTLSYEVVLDAFDSRGSHSRVAGLIEAVAN